jgi:hypothetical protein
MESNDDDDEPLPKVTCTSTKCDEDLHCFRPKRAKPETLTGGKCHSCDVDLVDWELAHARDIDNVDALFAVMRKEFIREKFWSIPLDDSLKRSLSKKGRVYLLEKVAARLKRTVGAPGRELYMDGMQTPTEQPNIIYYAQHATATCCRKCMKYWHGIPYEHTLTESELSYFQQLIAKYVDVRVPGLQDLPERGVQMTLSFPD